MAQDPTVIVKPDVEGHAQQAAMRSAARIRLAWDDSEIEVFHSPGGKPHNQASHGNRAPKGWRNVPGKTGHAKKAADERAAYDKAKAEKKAKASAAAKKGWETKKKNAAKKAADAERAAKNKPAPTAGNRRPKKATAEERPDGVAGGGRVSSRERKVATEERMRAQDHQDKVLKPPPDERKLQKDAHEDYMLSGYKGMNGALRGKTPMTPGLAKGIEGMDGAFKSSGTKSSQRMGVSRQVSFEHPFSGKPPGVGHEFVEDGYMSTTTHQPGTNSFFGDTLIHINVPEGTTFMAGVGGEGEIIFPRGTKMRVTNVLSTPPGRTEFAVDIIP